MVYLESRFLNESQAQNGDSQYNNLPIPLAKQKYIQSAAHCPWLNNDQSAASTILFGGVDTENLDGSLVTLSFIQKPSDPDVQRFYVALQGVQMNNANGNPIPLSGGLALVPAVLESGVISIYVVSLRTSNWAYLSGNEVYLPVSALNLSNWLVHPARGAGVTL
jgi:hypothetical protein